MNNIKIYFNIIRNARNRIYPKDLYGEKHHILPSSLYPKHRKNPKNIVKLTAKEHVICHWLLYRIFSGYRKQKMAHAFFSMCRSDANQKRYISSRIYEISKKAHAQATSDFFKNRKLSEEQLIRRKEKSPNGKEVTIEGIHFNSFKAAMDYFKVSKYLIKKYLDGLITFEYLSNKEYRNECISDKISNRMKQYRKLHSNKGKTYEEMYGYEKSLLMKEKCCKSNSIRIFSDETKIKISNSLKGKTSSFKGKSHSNESKMNMSLSKKGKSRSRYNYILIDNNQNRITIEKIGVRQFFRDTYECSFPTALKSSLKTGIPVKQGKWKGWNIFYA
jgi:hypothetical protein